MTEQKKVMVLGAGRGQIPFIKICKDRGYYVIVASTKGEYPGFKLADKAVFEDTRDKESILKIAEQECIDAIITDQTDVSVPTVAYVAEEMKLRGIGYDTAMKFTNKYLMRIAAKDSGIDVPEFGKANTLEDAKKLAESIGFPVMMKPVDSSGSRGVVRLDSVSDVEKFFFDSLQYSLAGDVIIEKFIVGTSYMVNGFAMDYEYINLDLGTKDSFKNIDIYVTKLLKLHSANSVDNPVWQRVLDANKRLVKGIGLKFGITHADYLYDEQTGKVYLVEIAGRGGGTYISSDITPMATGFHSNEALIDYAVEGKSLIISEERLSGKVCGYIRFGLPAGEIVSIEGMDSLNEINGVRRVMLEDCYVGAKTYGIRNDTDAFGPIIFEAISDSEADEVISKVRESLKISVQTETGIKGIIW